MDSFYVIEKNIITRDKYYKVYVKQDELWFGQMGGQFYGTKQLYSMWIIMEMLFQLLKYIWITPSGRKKELQLDKITEREQFLLVKGCFIIALEQLSEIVINEIGNGSIKFKYRNGLVKKFELEDETDFEQLELAFNPVKVKRINYWW